MHFASPSIDPALYPRIVALVMFGDPGNRGANVVSVLPEGGITPAFPDTLAQKLKENCAAGDPVSQTQAQTLSKYLHFPNPPTTRSAQTTAQQ
jgi:hypothetical protein